MEPQTSVDFGGHSMSIELPALVHVRFAGEIQEDETRTFLERCREGIGDSPFAILCETHELRTVTPASRKVFAEGFKQMPLRGVAFVGASLRTRAIVTFVVGAINVVRPAEAKLQTSFFEDRDEAKSWLSTVVT